MPDYLELADWRRRVASLYAEVRDRATIDPQAAFQHWCATREELFRAHPQSPLPIERRADFQARYFPYDPALRFEAPVEQPSSPAPFPSAEQPSPPTHADWAVGSAEPTAHPALPASLYGLAPDRPRPVPVQPAAGEGSDVTATASTGSAGGSPASSQPRPSAVAETSQTLGAAQSSNIHEASVPTSDGDAVSLRRVGVVEVPFPAGARRLALFWMGGYGDGLFLSFRDATNGADTYGGGRYLLDAAKSADLGGDPARGTLVLDFNFAYHPSCAWDPRWVCPLVAPDNRLDIPVRAGEQLS